MMRPPAMVAAAWLALIAPTALSAATPEAPPSRHPDAKDTYTVTSRLRLVPPFNVDDMTDDFQDARVIARDADSITVEITYYPLHRPPIGENANWRKDYAGMTEYLRATPAENWDETMRRYLLAELRTAGIEPDRLTDKPLVEQVSRWAMKRARFSKEFAIWTVYYPDGKPAIHPALRVAFDRQKRSPDWTDQQTFDEEALGRSMFYNKVHGSCTSSSIYLTTIFRALGLPTRTVFCIPPFDVKDAAQAKMFYAAIHHHQVRETVRKALDGMNSFANHLFNEVYVGNRWVRLNYSTLGQPILDAHYFGLLTHIYTSSDLSKVPLAETWGARLFTYPAGQPRLSSNNPYQLLAVSDRFGENATVENPAVAPPPELTTATIVAVLRPDSPELPRFVTEGLKTNPQPPDFFISYKEWLTGSRTQMRQFRTHVGQDFVLSSPGHPEVRARLSGLMVSQDDGSFQAYTGQIVADDRDKIAAGAAYTLKPINISDTYRWQVAGNLAPIRLKD